MLHLTDSKGNPLTYLGEDFNRKNNAIPADNAKIQEFIKSFKELHSFPNSLRYFNKLHKAGRALINSMKTKKLFSQEKEYSLELCLDNGDTIDIRYEKKLMNDDMFIYIFSESEGSGDSLYLSRDRGCQTKNLIRKKGLITTILMEKKLTETISGISKYEPLCLNVSSGFMDAGTFINYV